MGTPNTPAAVRLIIGILAKNAEFLELASMAMIQRFGGIDYKLEPIPFYWTNYYRDELGESPIRSILSFENPIPRESIVDIKLWTNEMEFSLSGSEQRFVNLDPGYLTLGQFFLATTKDQRQRVYIRDGIYVEPTLYFEGGAWKPFPWTYRDWQSDEYRAFFDIARQRYAYQCTTGKAWSKRA